MTQYLEELKKLIGQHYTDEPELLVQSAKVLEADAYPITERNTPPTFERLNGLKLEPDIKDVLYDCLYEAHRQTTGPHSTTISLSQRKLPLGSCRMTEVDYLCLKKAIQGTPFGSDDDNQAEHCVYFSIKDALRLYESMKLEISTKLCTNKLSRAILKEREARKEIEVRLNNLQEACYDLRTEVLCLKCRKTEKE